MALQQKILVATFCILVFSFVGGTVYGQEIQYKNLSNNTRVELPYRGSDNEQRQLILLWMFRLKADSVIQPIDMAADYPGMALKTFKIIPPRYANDVTGTITYGFVNHHHGNGNFPNHTLVVVGNTNTINGLQVWVDMNHNLDLTDDGEPQSLNLNNSFLKLDLFPFGLVIQLNLFREKELESCQNMYAKAIGLIQGKREFAGMKQSFRERRLAIWFGMQVTENDTLYWAVKDVNANGRYNDVGVDIIMVSNRFGEFNTTNATKYNVGVTIDWLGRRFVVNKVLPESEKLTLSVARMLKINNEKKRSLLIGKKIPRLTFCGITGVYKPGPPPKKTVQRQSIRHFKGKYTYIVVWNADDSVFVHDSSSLHQLCRNLPDSLQILMLNHGGSGKYVYRYNNRYETHMHHGFCSKEVAEKLKLQTLPQTFLINPKQKLIAINMSFLALNTFIH